MPRWDVLALGILLPAFLCGILLAVSQRLGDRARGALSGLAFGGAWLITFVAFVPGLPAWPWGERRLSGYDWLAWVVVLAMLASLLFLAPIPARALSAVSRPVLSAGLVLLSLGRWADRSGSWTALGVSFLGLLAVWTAGDSFIGRGSALRAAPALAVAAIGTSLANLFASSALLGALAGGIGACLGAAAVLAALSPGFRLHPSASAVVALVLGGCVIQGLVFSELPLPSAFLLAGAVLMPGLVELLRPSKASRWRDALIALALAAVPAALAAWIAWSPSEGLY